MTDRRQTLNVTPLNHPLDPYAPFIERLVDGLGGNDSPIRGTADYVSSHILEAVRCALDAERVAVFRRESVQWALTAQSLSEDDSAYRTQSWVDGILAQFSEHAQFYPLLKHHGVFHAYEENGMGKLAALIPLPSSRATDDLMMIGGVAEDSAWLGDVCGRILMSLYVATCEFTTVQVPLIEAAILDDLRRTYGFVPMVFYRRRFDLFCQRLAQMQIHFEPVLRLDPDYPYIDSWEALARDPVLDCAPVDLFNAAELWGDRFMVHLDAYLMRQAVMRYRAACQSPFGRRQEDMRELSVNVYPPSLMQDDYFDAIRLVVEERLIQPEKLVLEISEKLPLPIANPQEVSIELFKKQLGRYVRDLKVGFSIDDFGAGHASVSRLTGLNPSHVKIDRDLLYQEREPMEITLRFVLDLASTRLRAPKVVVEGFDHSSPMSLGQLYRVGIRYVQGHIIGKASPELHRLGKDHSMYLSQLIQRDG